MSFQKPRQWMAGIAILAASCIPSLNHATDLTSAQAEHALLEQFSGNWSFERWTAPTDGSDPQLVGSGEVHAEMIGHFFLLSRWKGTIMDFDFDAVQLLGYNAERQVYSGTWADSIMSFRWELNGSLDPEGEELTLESSGPSPTGFVGNFRERYRFESSRSLSIIAEVQQDDGWHKMMTTQMRRMD